jgi:hypothetical protein
MSVVQNIFRNTEDAVKVVTRPSSTALFCIDSDDRYNTYSQRRSNPTYPFQFNIQKNESLFNGFFRRMALTEIRMNWTLPNISTAWGNNQILFTYKVGSGGTPTTYTVTIPDGFYPVAGRTGIAEALQSRLASLVLGFQVNLNSEESDEITFSKPIGIDGYFKFDPISATANTRQLYDMLNIPPSSSAPVAGGYWQFMTTGIPNMRATEYVDVVCSQLTYNQDLKDASSSQITRDMMCRIYTDDSTSSQALQVVNNYSGTTTGSVAISSLTSQNGNVVVFTVAGSVPLPDDVYGSIVVMSGITGGSGWNTSGRLITGDITSPYTITIIYDFTPIGTPSFGGSPLVTLYQTLVSQSIPQVTWDSRVNGVTPFVLYRQFPFPKQIRWDKSMPIGNVTFTLYDDQGRNIQDIWTQAYPPTTPTGTAYANSFVWNASLLLSED